MFTPYITNFSVTLHALHYNMFTSVFSRTRPSLYSIIFSLIFVRCLASHLLEPDRIDWFNQESWISSPKYHETRFWFKLG